MPVLGDGSGVGVLALHADALHAISSGVGPLLARDHGAHSGHRSQTDHGVDPSIAGGDTIATRPEVQVSRRGHPISRSAIRRRTGRMLSKIADFYDDEVDRGGDLSRC